jgi:hypothetical protein
MALTKVQGAGINGMTISSDGEITKSSQPCFSVTKAGEQTNIAIDSDVTVTMDTEIFDVGSNFASNTFTAPVTGKYQLNASLRVSALDSAATYYYILIKTSNRNYGVIFDPDFGQDAGFWSFSTSALADMDANDTAFVMIQQGGGSQQTDIVYAVTWTNFNGALIC